MLFIRDGEGSPILTQPIRSNVRTPDQTMGDIWVQVAELEVMDKRVLRMLDDYQLDSLEAFALEIFTRSERVMRDAISRVPKGTLDYVMYTDGLDDPFELHVSLNIKDDEILVDYTGTSDQQLCNQLPADVHLRHDCLCHPLCAVAWTA